MSVPTSPYLRLNGVLIDRISNFGAFPPTVKIRDRWNVHLILLNHADPAATSGQMRAIEDKGLFAGSWEPVPTDLPNTDGADLARRVHERALELGPRAIGLNLEGLTISQIREFLWGRPPWMPGQLPIRGYRGAGGAVGSTGGYHPGMPTFWIDEAFKDGSVKPHVDLQVARVMLVLEGFDGLMGQIDHPRAILDRITGFRSSGPPVAAERYPPEQVTGCYDAALGIRIRGGLYFTAERLPGIFTLRRRLLNRLRARSS